MYFDLEAFMAMNKGRTPELCMETPTAETKRKYDIYVDGQKVNTYPLSYPQADRAMGAWRANIRDHKHENVILYERVEFMGWV